MKYMGSKRQMLKNGLGDVIAQEVTERQRFVDLFAGSGSVASFVATKYAVPVVAYDLQLFSAILTGAVVGRDAAIDAAILWSEWYPRAADFSRSVHPPKQLPVTRSSVAEIRRWAADQQGLITRSYGGYYFSAHQSVWLDALRETLPAHEPERTVALAALLYSASQCAAAPGHTAQPFQPTRTAKPYLVEAWGRDVPERCRIALTAIASQYAKVRGHAQVADANEAAKEIREGDVVFVDPPYSGVHYSRFYHVLETLARGHCSAVAGAGRYPPPIERPRSKYSVPSESVEALEDLFLTIASRCASAIVTFPRHQCSNGLSGTAVTALAERHFNSNQRHVVSIFSTLGGNNGARSARRRTKELILVLRPRRR